MPCRPRATLPLLVALLAACAPAPAPRVQQPAPVVAAAALPNDVRWVRASAEWRAIALQTYRVATERLEAMARGRAAGSWAVILDADETVLDNSEYQRRLAASGTRYADSTWALWVRERAAVAVPGAPAFTQRVRALGGRVAIVTNRADSLCAETRDNLRGAGVHADAVLCKPPGGSDKNPRFAAVQRGEATPGAGAVAVLMWVGDNIQDFPGLTQRARTDDAALAPFGVRWFLLPNPMYGSWEGGG
jgi:5'-nucleotidase (lipoprotein e(P4) family)